MNQKKAKQLRQALKVAHLPESVLMINKRTKVIRLGWGKRAALQRLKKQPEGVRTLLVDGLTEKRAA